MNYPCDIYSEGLFMLNLLNINNIYLPWWISLFIFF